MGTQSEKQIALAYRFLASGNPKQAKQILEDALTDDLENREIIFALRCCSFWLDTMSYVPSLEAFEQGIFLPFPIQCMLPLLLQLRLRSV